jgi:3-deoxy-D-manno-octulosonic-acid transferase
MPYLLNLLYAVLLILGSPWLLAGAIRKGKYREGLAAKLLGLVSVRDSTAICAWLHAVSMGEVSLIAPLVEELQRRHPNWDIVISTTTSTGYALAKSRYPHDTVFYCPLDFSWAVRQAIARIRPSILILAELELWPNLIAAARAAGAKVAVINGRLSDRSFGGYRRFRPWVKRLLRKIDLIATQNPLYADRFLEIGAQNNSVYVTGSLKFDGAETDRDNPATMRLRSLVGFQPSDTIFLAGSTQHPEEQLALDAFRQLAPTHPELRLVIVPRHPDRFDAVGGFLAASGLAWQRRSGLDTEGANPYARVLLVDKVGELGAWWGTAGIAYVGGSLGKRNGQNMIEPAAYGAAVAFGPMTRNFRDVVTALLTAEAAVVVKDGTELTAFVRRCLDEPSYGAKLGNRAQRVVASQLGAACRTADLLDALVSRPAALPGHRAVA